MKQFIKAFKSYVYMLRKIRINSPGFIMISMLATVLGSIPNIVNIIILQKLINMLLSGICFKKIVYILGIYFCCNTLIVLLTNYLSTIKIPCMQQTLIQKLHAEIYHITSSVYIEQYDDPSFLNQVSAAIKCVDEQGIGAVGSVSTLVSNLLSIGALTTIILTIEPVLIILAALSSLISFYYGINQSKIGAGTFEKLIPFGRQSEYIKSIFIERRYAKELHQYNGEDVFQNYLQKNTLDIINILLKQGSKLFNVLNRNSFITNMIAVILLGFLSWQVKYTETQIGSFVAAFSGTQQLSGQLISFSFSISQIYKDSLIIDKYKNFCNLLNKCTDSDNAIMLGDVDETYSIDLKSVSFHYKDRERLVLKKIDLHIGQNSHIAIVGKNGSGKSTLAKIISGLLFPTDGDISYNGKSYFDISVQNIRNISSYVFQDYVIFSLSIAENILLAPYEGNSIQTKIIEDALSFVGLSETVALLPDGIETKITKRFCRDGVIFSGGELQKIAIARAYAHRRPVMIFDEATSSLDIDSERKIILNSKNNHDNITTIWITHRRECLALVDKIVYLENGKIAEEGSFDELMKIRGSFYDLFTKRADNVKG